MDTDEALVKRYYGYIPRFVGGPRDGERADASWSLAHGRGCMAGYIQKPGDHHYYFIAAWAGDHARCGEECTVRRLNLDKPTEPRC